MDFSFTDDQRELASLAARIFGDAATDERLKEVEASADAFDRRLWDELAKAGLLGVTVPEERGGLGLGVLEMCLVLEAQGRAVAPVPLWPTLVGALVEPPGDEVVACALAGECALDGGKVFGIATAVPAVHLAAHVVVAAGEHVVVVDPRGPGVEAVRERTTSGEPLFTVTFDGAPATASLVPPSRLVQTATVALCALQVGVAERALRMTAEYTSSREQFGRPLATFQAVQQRAADAYIDVEAMRWTMWQAAWRLDAEGEAADAVDVAKFWASEGGARVLAAAQHLHGGIGVDLDYPLHRYLVWSKQLEVWLGGASARLASIGDRIAVGGV